MTAPVLETRGLTVTFQLRAGGGLRRRSLTAVRGVDLEVLPGETVALVGESGSGKSTTARAVCGLVPFEGEVLLSGERASAIQRTRRAGSYRQMVFQDPYSSLDPLMTVGDSIAEPLTLLSGRSSGHAARVRALLESVRLPAGYAARLPKELSGGQRQRVAIARALATEPKLVVCDEALSALDASTQGEVLAILQELREQRGTAYLFIAHDLAVVRHIADRVAVMYLGSVVESGPTEEVFRDPRHPYTQALLAAAPIPHPRLQRQQRAFVVGGDPPDPSRLPGGCPFHPRCPLAIVRCKTETPPATAAQGRTVICHVNKAADPAEAVARVVGPVETSTPEVRKGLVS